MHNENNIQSVGDYVRVYGAYLVGTPTGIAILLLGVLLFLVTLTSTRIKWVWLALLFYCATLSFNASASFKGELLFPFNVIRSLGRPLTLLFLVLLLIPSLQASRGGRWKLVAAPLVAYFVYELWFSALLGFGDSVLRSALGGLIFVALFTTLGLGLSKWIQAPGQAYTALRAVVAAASIVLLGTLYHVALGRSSMVVMSGRLTGTTGNPQALGAILAFTLPAVYGLLFRRGESKAWRIYLAAALTLSVVFIIWSGSRAGALITLVGLVAFFRLRLGQFTLVAAVAAILVLGGLQVFGDSASGGTHLLNTTNTRAEVFARLWDTFTAHPVTGAMTEDACGESSYLSTLSAFGILGLIPMVVMLWLMVRYSWRVLRRRRDLGRHAVLADIAVATVAEILAASAFDNHLMGTLTFAVFLLYVSLTLYAALLDPAVFTPAPAPGTGEGAGYPYDAWGSPVGGDGYGSDDPVAAWGAGGYDDGHYEVVPARHDPPEAPVGPGW